MKVVGFEAFGKRKGHAVEVRADAETVAETETVAVAVCRDRG